MEENQIFNNIISTDERYMRRCLQIARNGLLTAKPNPSVGAVIVSGDGRIIGEGFTSAYGGPHAEVNAFASVSKADEHLLHDATVYVSLEPCSHWGHTPPCCDLIIRKGVKRVVCGCVDPFAKVQGRGIRKMREAGIEVTVGVLEEECQRSNRRFMASNMLHRPFITLKWAESSNHFLDDCFHPTMFSTPFTQMLAHRLRAESDAILVGRTTFDRDHPQLNVREWTGRSPKRILLTSDESYAAKAGADWHCFGSIDEALQWMQESDMQQLLVEGGARTLQAFIDGGYWDEIRVETAPRTVDGGTPSPRLPEGITEASRDVFDDNVITLYERKDPCYGKTH